MGLEAFLPFVLSLAIALFFVFELRKKNRHLEELKSQTARLHSAQRAQLAAIHFNSFVEVELSGVLPDDKTLLIGYRKRNEKGAILFPGERIKNESFIEGTIIAWPKKQTELVMKILDQWTTEKTKVFLRVNEDGEQLIIFDPLRDETISIELVPNN